MQYGLRFSDGPVDEALSDLQPDDAADLDYANVVGDLVEHAVRDDQHAQRYGGRWRYRSGAGARDDAIQFCLSHL